MIIVVNDANVLIDLVKLQLLPHFFSLELEFYTTDLILDELHDWQVQELQMYIDNGSLTVIQLTGTELIDMSLLQTEKRQLSEQDCSAIVCARKVSGDLLTSIITPQVAIEKLTELREVINPRLHLPKIECESRLELWGML